MASSAEFQRFCIWVGSLKAVLAEDDIFQYLQKYGLNVEHVNLVKDRTGCGLDSFAFIDVFDEENSRV